MLNVNEIYFLGYSGHAYVAIESAIASGFNVLGYFDRQESTDNPFNLLYLGYERNVDIKELVKGCFVFPAIGSNVIRKKIYQKLCQDDIRQIKLISPSASVSNSAIIGLSTLVNPNACVNAFVKIGNCCIINTGAIIEHECEIGDFSHIAPGAVLAGNVLIGSNCFIGANAVIKQGVRIADDVIIGAGTVVLKNILKKGTWVGNPAKLIER